MKSITLALAAVAASAWIAQAQTALAPDSLFNTVTCAQFSDMDFDQQVTALQALPSAGDDMGAGDEEATKNWTRTVEAGCERHPDMLLADMATQLLGGD